MTNLLQDAGRVDADELFTATARIFGWGRRTQETTRRLEQVLSAAADRGRIAREGSDVRLAMPAEER